jgi:hypothetical protein
MYYVLSPTTMSEVRPCSDYLYRFFCSFAYFKGRAPDIQFHESPGPVRAHDYYRGVIRFSRGKDHIALFCPLPVFVCLL